MKTIILDRDGVINFDSKEYIKSPDEWHPIPGSLEAIASLTKAGYRIFVATNQSGVARKLYDLTMLQHIHDKMLAEIKKGGGHIEEIFFCPHHPIDNCQCRKPKPGLLLQIKQKYGLKLDDIYFIGDTYSDVEAAQAAGCKPIIVLTGMKEKILPYAERLISIPSFADLKEAVAYVLKQ